MEAIKNLKRIADRAIDDYANYLGISSERFYTWLENDNDTLFELPDDENIELDWKAALLSHATVNAYFASLHEMEMEFSTKDIISWASAYGLLRGKLEAISGISKRGEPGGKARAEKYKAEVEEILSAYRSMDSLLGMSAEKAASHIVNKSDLSHRKIADTIRKARKMQIATQKAHDA